jgi:ABC-2 type transport system permease protein
MRRLTQIEARKMVDTRAGRWLLAAAGMIAAGVTAIQLATDSKSTASDVLVAAGATLAFLVPLLAVLLVTGEWSQRTALQTFALTPRRERVVAAKLLAGLGLCVATYAAAVVLAGAGIAIAGVGLGGLSARAAGGLALLLVLAVTFGAGLGMLLLNSTAAVCVYLLLPTVSGLHAISHTVAAVMSWFDQTAWEALTDHRIASGLWWARIGVTTAVWVVLPLALGLWRVQRSEIK